jgi:hypothetical protein
MPATTEPSATAGGEHTFAFGPFRLLSAQRLLLEGDTPVRLGSRAFDTLAALVERAGEIVSKEELIARAWPQTFVEESNLKIQVSALRRALGDGRGAIATSSPFRDGVTISSPRFALKNHLRPRCPRRSCWRRHTICRSRRLE